MKSQVKELSPVEVEVEVEVPWEKVNGELENAYRKLQQSARVRGFRPGKTPRHLVRQLMGKSVKSEVTNALVQESVTAAVKEHSLEPVTIPEVRSARLEEGEPMTFTARMEIRPRIEKVDTSSLELDAVSVAVEEEQVEKELQALREQNAELLVPEPTRPSRRGDVLVVDYRVKVDGEEREDMNASDRQIELGSEQLLPEFDRGLMEVRPGELKRVEVTFPEDHPRQELKGTTAEFEISVKEVKEKRLPAIDDELAKDIGYDTLDALKSKIRERLEQNERKQAENQQREQLVERLVQKNPIPVPPSLIERQEQAMLRELFQFQQLLGKPPSLNEEIQKDIRERAERKVRAALLFIHIARENKMEVTEEQVEERLKQLAESSGKNLAKVRAEYKDEMREALESQLMEDKLIEHLLSLATIKERATEPEGSIEEARK
jgi:trigger factor